MSIMLDYKGRRKSLLTRMRWALQADLDAWLERRYLRRCKIEAEEHYVNVKPS